MVKKTVGHFSLEQICDSGQCFRMEKLEKGEFLVLAGNRGLRKQSRELADQPLYQKYVLPVIKEIETNYSQPLTVTGLCSQVYVTPQYLSRLFKRFLGSSVYTYLMNYRIQKAKELLMNRPETEIQHIAHQVGFQDASHFISVFRTATGYTPLEFRKLH